jgi:hypothetical protein
MKGYLVTALVAAVTMAIVFRVAPVRAALLGA